MAYVRMKQERALSRQALLWALCQMLGYKGRISEFSAFVKYWGVKRRIGEFSCGSGRSSDIRGNPFERLAGAVAGSTKRGMRTSAPEDRRFQAVSVTRRLFYVENRPDGGLRCAFCEEVRWKCIGGQWRMPEACGKPRKNEQITTITAANLWKKGILCNN